MAERVGDFEWRGEGEEAEVAVYAPDAGTADRVLRHALPAARLPGVESPVHAAASRRDYGRVAVSATHAAPGLFSAPEWGLLLVAEVPVSSLGVPFDDAPRLLSRRLSEVVPPSLGEGALRGLVETGTVWAAGEGFIWEEDLALFPGARPGDPDSLGRRAISAGTRDWARPGRVGVFRVAEVLDAEAAGELGLEAGALAFVAGAGAEDLGRLALAGHRDRISSKAVSEDFGAPPDLPAAPSETEEARDLVSASRAAANYAAGRAALVIWALRRALKDVGIPNARAAWMVGGLEDDGGRFFHRDGLAVADEGRVLVCGRTAVVGTGGMLRSAPAFGVPEVDGGWPWEEAGLCERVAVLGAPGGASGEG